MAPLSACSAAMAALLWGPSMSAFSTARLKMVDGQVRTSDVTDIRIVDAMLEVPREAFVPENKRPLAYIDLDLDVTEGGSARRFLIKPMVTAKLLQAAEIKATDTVLVVGCATGYAAALAAKLAGQVTATGRQIRPRGIRTARPTMSSSSMARPRSCRTGFTISLRTAAGWSASSP